MLISCPECNTKVSDKAQACPHCGFRIDSLVRCPDCGNMVRPGTVTCPDCGYPLSTAYAASKDHLEPLNGESVRNDSRLQQPASVQKPDTQGVAPTAHSTQGVSPARKVAVDGTAVPGASSNVSRNEPATRGSAAPSSTTQRVSRVASAQAKSQQPPKNEVSRGTKRIWYYVVHESVYGPVSADDIYGKILGGWLPPNVSTWKKGSLDWAPADSYVFFSKEEGPSATDVMEENSLAESDTLPPMVSNDGTTPYRYNPNHDDSVSGTSPQQKTTVPAEHETIIKTTAVLITHETHEPAGKKYSSKTGEKIIGIDLGTSGCAAAAIVDGQPTLVPVAEGVSIGEKGVPSYVAFTKNGQLLVGEPARRQAALNPETTVQLIKRKMGTDYTVSIFGKSYTPQQISGFILRKIKNDAEAFLGQRVSKAVVTVPSYFNDTQRQATKDAAEIAGLEVVRLINESTATAFAYGLDKTEGQHKILVFALGGGTAGVTIMEFGGNVFTVKSTSGDTQLGGTDMDTALLDYVAKVFYNQSSIDLHADKVAMQRLREGVEKAKIELSTTLQTTISLQFIAADTTGPKHLVMPITRAKLENLVQPIIDRCREPINRALSDAGLTPQQINNIILVGGPTRMPIVRKFVESYFGKTPEWGVDPIECVAMGAAIQGGIMGGEVKGGMVLVDVTPLTLGIETLGGVFTEMIKRNTAVPISKTQIFTTSTNNQTQVEIHVLQGERRVAKDNVSLGHFILDGIAPAKKGEPKIDVSFDIDSNGIMHVAARDKATGKEQHITIENPLKLKDSELERMKREIEQFTEQDKNVKKEVELKNRADQVVFNGRKTLRESVAKISPDVKADAERELTELEILVRDGRTLDIEAKIDEVKTVFSKYGSMR